MKVEDTYYSVLDFFEEKGIGLPWAYNDFLETKGIPALPFTAALLVVLLGAIFWVSTANQPTDVSFTLSMKDQKGDSLYDVSVKIIDEQGNVLKETTASDGQTITLSGIHPHSELTIEATKDGYDDKSISVLSSDEKVVLSFTGTNDAVVGKLKLVDAETQTTITDATITAQWSGGDTPLTTNPGTDGIILLNVPLNQEISLTIKAPNYEDLDDTITFSGGDVKIKQLTPKAGATTGPSVLLIKAIDGSTQLPLNDVHIHIENVQTGETISDLDASSGLDSENLTKGQVVRVTVSKEGYLTYTSNVDFPGGKTLRSEEETIIATMQNGGITLTVIAQNQSNSQPLQGVSLTLLDASYTPLESQTTTFSGDADFGGLNQTKAYYMLGYQANFFPVRMSVDWSSVQSGDDGKTLILPLSPFTSADAGIMTAFVNEDGGKIATAVNVRVDEKVGSDYIPLVSTQPADTVGSFSVRLPVGMSVRVTAEKDDESASATQDLTIVQGLNKVVLNLQNTNGIVAFNLKYSNGKPFIGTLRVEDTGKGLLFNGDVNGGITRVSVGENGTVYLTATSIDGKTFTQTVSVAGKDSVDVILDAAPAANGGAPAVSFVGLFNSDGQPIPGFAPETESFARFSVTWPASTTSGGLFVRVGSDALVSVESQYVGIVGVNADASSVSYGKSWTATPKPGNESKDRKSGGGAGTFNKWIEIINTNPVGVSTFDVQIKTKKGIPTGTQDIHYRAFATIGNQLIRTPADSELGFAPYVSTKSGLYASTQTTAVPVYESIPLCQNGICVSISLVDKDNRVFPIGNAQAMTGQPYAIEVTILPGLIQDNVTTGIATPASTTSTGEGLVPLSAIGPTGTVTSGLAGFQNPGYTLKALTTGENPLLVFTKTEVNTFGKLVEGGAQDTSISVTLPPSLVNNPSRARVQFMPQNAGQTAIDVQITSSTSSWQQTIPIEIVEPRALNVSVPDHVAVGDKLPIQVDDEQDHPITTAQITITKTDGSLAASMKGTGLPSKGENGHYVIDKSLAKGLYSVSIHVPGFIDFQDTVSVGIDSPIEIPTKIEIDIPAGKTSATQNVQVINKTGVPLTTLTGEFNPFETFPSAFTVEIGAVPSIPANGKVNLPISVTYAGDPTDTAVVSGSGNLTLHADAGAQFPVSATAQLSVVYNKQLDSSCLTFDKSQLSVTLMGENQPYGNMYGGYSSINGINSFDPLNNSTTTLNGGSSYYGFNTPQYNSSLYNAQGYNPYGYNTSGYYQNAETKSVSVKAKNNCGQDLLLVPGISTVDGQVQVDGLKVAAVDSSFNLLKGQEKQVSFTISNSLFHAGFVPQIAPYRATFTAPQLQASLPINVQFLDRSRAIQAPPSVELNLITSGKQKATDRAVIPITNIGAGPVYDIRMQLTGEKPTDVTTRLENAFGGGANYQGYGTSGLNGYDYGYGNSLQPGQTLTPPIAIIGETTTDKQGLSHQQLQITGLIEGRRTVLRTVDVFIRTGGSSCLEISAFDTPISFVSSEITGTLSKRITIRNKCLEPVQITTLNPPSISANNLSLTPVSGSPLIEKDAEEEFNVVLSKSAAFKNQFAISVKGVMVLTQKPVESNTLPVEIALGANELEHSNTTNGVTVNVCEGGTTTVHFPTLAKKDECAQAYCDAEQASNMLSSLVEQQIAKAVQLMQSKKNDAAQFANCDITKRYCTFAQLGLKSPNVDLFLENDNLTPELLEFIMRSGTYPRLARIQAEGMSSLAGEGANDSFAQRLGTGLGNKLFVAPIQGCGKYTVSIIGGVEIVANQLQSDEGINIGIKVSSTQKTAECQDKIYNAAVFLPKDRSITMQNTHQTLAGIVKYDGTELADPAKWLAQEVFGSETRATTNTGSNHLDLRVGNLTQSIVELTLDPATSGNVPKRIITTVRKTQGKVAKEAVVEAGKIITSLGQNVNGCITQDEQTWRITSVKDVGQFTYAGCPLTGTGDGGLVVRPILTCCSLTTKSDIQSNATYDLSPSGNDPIPGVKSLDLYEKDPQSNATTLVPGAKLTVGAEYPLVFDSKNQIYAQDVLLCGISDPATQQQANKAVVETSATRALDGSKAGPLAFQLRTCTLDADDALAKAYNQGMGTHYATVDWPEDVETKTIKEVVNEAINGKKVPEAFFSFQDQDIHASDNPVYTQKFKQKEVAALGIYTASCLAACGACNVGLGLLSGGYLAVGAGAAVADCALSCGVGAAAGAYEVYKDDAQGTLLETPVNWVEGTYGKARDLALDQIPGGNANQAGATAAIASATTTGIKGLVKPLAIVKDPKDPSKYQKLVSPATVPGVTAAIDPADLGFLDQVGQAVGDRITTNETAWQKYTSTFSAAPPTVAGPGVVVNVGGKPIPAAPTPLPKPNAKEISEALSETKGYDDIIQHANAGFDAIEKKYGKEAWFDKSQFAAFKKEIVDNRLKKMNDSVSIMKNEMVAAKPVSYPASLLQNGRNELGSLTKDAKKVAAAIKDTPGISEKLWARSKNVAKGTTKVARSLVCGGAGSVAGYYLYRDNLSDEIENKITLNEGSTNVIDPTTNELVFHKGQTYAFTVTPTTGTGKSKSISIDIVSPTQRLDVNGWLDADCSGK